VRAGWSALCSAPYANPGLWGHLFFAGSILAQAG
jgi:hypothetical protein